MRNTPKIVVTLEGNSWEDISREMGLIVKASRASRIEDNPGQGIVAPTERSGHDALLRRLQWVLGEYVLGPEERAEILERMR